MSRAKRNLSKEDIKSTIWKRGSNLRELSINAGLHYDACSEALRRPFPTANKAIANFLNRSLHDLWPLWYDQNGIRITAYEHKQNLAQQNPPVSAKSARQI